MASTDFKLTARSKHQTTKLIVIDWRESESSYIRVIDQRLLLGGNNLISSFLFLSEHSHPIAVSGRFTGSVPVGARLLQWTTAAKFGPARRGRLRWGPRVRRRIRRRFRRWLQFPGIWPGLIVWLVEKSLQLKANTSRSLQRSSSSCFVASSRVERISVGPSGSPSGYLRRDHNCLVELKFVELGGIIGVIRVSRVRKKKGWLMRGDEAYSLIDGFAYEKRDWSHKSYPFQDNLLMATTQEHQLTAWVMEPKELQDRVNILIFNKTANCSSNLHSTLCTLLWLKTALKSFLPLISCNCDSTWNHLSINKHCKREREGS